MTASNTEYAFNRLPVKDNTLATEHLNAHTETARKLYENRKEAPWYVKLLWATACHSLYLHPSTQSMLFSKAIPNKWLKKLTNHNGAGFIHMAARWGDDKMLNYALKAGCDVNTTDALHSNHTVLLYLLDNKAQDIWFDYNDNLTQVKRIHYQLFDKLEKHGYDFNYKNSFGEGLLFQIIKGEHHLIKNHFVDWMFERYPQQFSEKDFYGRPLIISSVEKLEKSLVVFGQIFFYSISTLPKKTQKGEARRMPSTTSISKTRGLKKHYALPTLSLRFTQILSSWQNQTTKA